MEKNIIKEDYFYDLLCKSIDNIFEVYLLLKPVRNSSGKIIDFVYEYANEAALKFVGISKKEIVGKRLLELFPFHRNTGLFEKYIEVAESGVPLRLNSFKYEGAFSDHPLNGIFDISASKLDDRIAITWHDVTNYNEAIDRLTRQKTHSEILSELTSKLTEAAFDYKSVLNIIAKKTATLIKDYCIIGLVSEESDYVECASLYHKDHEKQILINDILTAFPLKKNEGLLEPVVKKRETLCIPFVDQEEIKKKLPEGYHDYLEKNGLYSLLIAPLKVHSKVIGVISLQREDTHEPFTNDDILFLEEIAIKAALSIHNALLYQMDLEEIEERKKAEASLIEAHKKLEESNKELQSFAYVTSHDLKEPLRMISGFMDLLSRKYKGKLDEQAEMYIHYAVDGAKRLNKMVSDILEYSRVVTGGKDFEEIESSEVLQTTLKNLAIEIEERRAEVTFDELPKVKADGTQLQRIFQNLISNAVKFNESTTPKVHISCKHNDHEWIFSVKDNGIGINKNQHESIFMLFRRLNPETYPGTGSGLSITKRIIDRHGGRIWVESEEGKGSTFFFSIPRQN
ncbi:MAG: ATP-binding protein [Clostridiales bacterium]